MEKDAALERRFQPVHVHEPTAEHALTILEVWLIKLSVPRFGRGGAGSAVVCNAACSAA